MKTIMIMSFLFITLETFAQHRLSESQEIAINGFRNPSVGLEYRYQLVSVHVGYYPTNFTSGVTTSFIKTGFTVWLLPVGQKEIPSSFYVSASYLRGLDREYKNDHGLMGDIGFRWMIWKGLNLRLGVGIVASPHHSLKVNPTPGISYSFQL